VGIDESFAEPARGERHAKQRHEAGQGPAGEGPSGVSQAPDEVPERETPESHATGATQGKQGIELPAAHD
jgi:hypothetical protein